MSAPTPSVPELSRPVNVESLSDSAEVCLEINADAGERANLARRFGLVQLESLMASVILCRTAADDVSLSGSLKAAVVQTCVVTLEPVRSTIEARISRVFSPRATPEALDETFIDPEGEEPPEFLAGDVVDAGEVVAETLGLEIDPFPRLPGAVFTAAQVPPEAEENTAKLGPFAALAKLKERR